uniref:Putative secreted protein n=1 Tax=Ixodes ricinus TaxID=34613 RepID=A0A6B0U5I6_IXORI
MSFNIGVLICWRDPIILLLLALRTSLVYAAPSNLESYNILRKVYTGCPVDCITVLPTYYLKARCTWYHLVEMRSTTLN